MSLQCEDYGGLCRFAAGKMKAALLVRGPLATAICYMSAAAFASERSASRLAELFGSGLLAVVVTTGYRLVGLGIFNVITWANLDLALVW